jgi:tRNA(adenine34) deaminase
VVGEGDEQSRQHRDITYHAELVAIRAACEALQQAKLPGCTLYTSHEPCLMCAYVIRHVGIARVVIGHTVAHVGELTSAYPLLTATNIPVWGPPPLVEVINW